jgi:hypothetical protein
MGWVFWTRSSRTRKVQLESARIVTGLTKFASRDSLYYETGWEPLSCRRKSRKDLKHDIFGLILTFRSKLFHNETVDGIKDVKDILSLLLGVV